jgi:hypothetical protein
MRVDIRIRALIQPARKPDNLTFGFKPGNSSLPLDH